MSLQELKEVIEKYKIPDCSQCIAFKKFQIEQIQHWIDHESAVHPTEECEQEAENTFIRVFKRWNEANIIIHKKAPIKAKQAFRRVFIDYNESEIVKALETYEKVIKNPKSWWTHKYRLEDFLARGVERFSSTTPEDYINGKRGERETVNIS